MITLGTGKCPHRAVHFDNISRTRFLMERIDVLGDDRMDMPGFSISASAKCAGFGCALKIWLASGRNH